MNAKLIHTALDSRRGGGVLRVSFRVSTMTIQGGHTLVD